MIPYLIPLLPAWEVAKSKHDQEVEDEIEAWRQKYELSSKLSMLLLSDISLDGSPTLPNWNDTDTEIREISPVTLPRMGV